MCRRMLPWCRPGGKSCRPRAGRPDAAASPRWWCATALRPVSPGARMVRQRHGWHAPSPARFVGDTPQHHSACADVQDFPAILTPPAPYSRSRAGRSIRRWLRRGGTHRRGAGQGSRSRPQRATRPLRDHPVCPASAIAAGHRHGRSEGRVGGPARRVDIHHAGRRVRSRGAYALHEPASAWSPSCRSVEMSTPRHVCSTWACCLDGTYVPARTSPRVCKPPEIMSACRHLDNVPRVPCPSVALYGSMGARRRARSMRSSASSSSFASGTADQVGMPEIGASASPGPMCCSERSRHRLSRSVAAGVRHEQSATSTCLYVDQISVDI